MVTVNGNIPINELLENTDLQKIPEIELSSLRENIDITNSVQKVRTNVCFGHRFIPKNNFLFLGIFFSNTFHESHQKVLTPESLGQAIGQLIHRDWFSFFMLEISFDKIGIEPKIAFTIGQQYRLFALHLLKRIVQS